MRDYTTAKAKGGIFAQVSVHFPFFHLKFSQDVSENLAVVDHGHSHFLQAAGQGLTPAAGKEQLAGNPILHDGKA